MTIAKIPKEADQEHLSGQPVIEPIEVMQAKVLLDETHAKKKSDPF